MTSTESPERAEARAELEKLWPVYKNTREGMGIRGASNVGALDSLRERIVGCLAVLGGEARVEDGTPLAIYVGLCDETDKRATRVEGLRRWRAAIGAMGRA